jgi:hypothetical protein
MNDQPKRHLDRAVLEIARNVFNGVRRELELRGLKIEEPSIRVWKEADSDYTSELTATVYDGNDIFDVIEFFIHRNGQLVATLSDIREWLDEVIISILREKDGGVCG